MPDYNTLHLACLSLLNCWFFAIKNNVATINQQFAIHEAQVCYNAFHGTALLRLIEIKPLYFPLFFLENMMTQATNANSANTTTFPTVQFRNWTCNVNVARYSNGRLALQLVSAVEDLSDDLFIGSPIATATINLPDDAQAENEVFIKDYSENEGMYDALFDAGYVGEITREVSSGFVVVPVVEKTELLKQLEARK